LRTKRRPWPIFGLPVPSTRFFRPRFASGLTSTVAFPPLQPCPSAETRNKP
jgi:hypothetical protein